MDQEHTESRAQGSSQEMELATLGGGCFWCLEPIFNDLMGVRKALAGYSGGTVPGPTYRQVCTGKTGHAEVVQITFDPEEISFREILEIFFAIHDPTTLNRQGADVGSQYRSVIFYHSEEQRDIATGLIRELEAAETWGEPIVTEIVPFAAFYRAEEDHQDYFAKNPGQAYCRVVIAPKVDKFRSKYGSKLKTKP
jgi:peptide-methionine (S)-S-oxide reductase